MFNHALVRPFGLFIGLICLLLALPAQAEPIHSLGEAINQAGRQRMLTQRIVKAYSQNILDVDALGAQAQMQGALALFQSQLDALHAFAPEGETAAALNVVDRLWVPFRDEASSGYSQVGMLRLAELSEPLLAASHQVVLRLEARSTTPSGRLVNIAGRQRMLSQRIAKFYMLEASGHQDQQVRSELEKAAEEFRLALKELLDSPVNSTEISQALAEVQKQWSVFEASFRLKQGEYAPLMIALYSEKVLKQMNAITSLYASL